MTDMAPDPQLEQEARKLASLEGQIEDGLKGPQLRQATVVSYDTATSTATIRLGGDTTDIAGVKHLASYFPTAGDTGAWLLKNETDLLLIGAIGNPGGGGGAPTGSITAFGGAAAPTGWLLCNGAAVSRTTYAALFAVLGTTYGAGDGSTTFGLPNLVQRFPLGKASTGTGSTLGGTGGALTDSISDTHTHPLNSSSSHAQLTWVSGSPEVRMNRKTTNGWTANIDAETVAAGAGSGANTQGLTLGGSSDDATVAATVDTVPPFQVVQYIVRT